MWGQTYFKLKVLTLPMLVLSCGGHTNKDRDPPVADSPKSQSANEDSTNDADKNGDKSPSVPIGNNPTTPDTDSGSKRPPPVRQQWKFKTIIREFGSFNGQPDRAALFIIGAEPGPLNIKSITGSELGSSYRAVYGELEKLIESPAGLFKQSALPMSDTQRQNLLVEYKGVTAVYFEQYQNALCDGTPKNYKIMADVLGAPAVVDVSFDAYAQEASDCLITRMVEMASMKK